MAAPYRPRFNIKTIFPIMGIVTRDKLIFNMGIPILVRRHLYIETAPWILQEDYCCMTHGEFELLKWQCTKCLTPATGNICICGIKKVFDFNPGCWKQNTGTWSCSSFLMDVVSNEFVSSTHWGRDKMAAVSQTTLSNVFSWMRMLEFWLRFHWSLFLRVQLTIIQHWFR